MTDKEHLDEHRTIWDAIDLLRANKVSKDMCAAVSELVAARVKLWVVIGGASLAFIAIVNLVSFLWGLFMKLHGEG